MKDYEQFWQDQDIFKRRGKEPEPDLGRSRVPPGEPRQSPIVESLPGVRYKKGDVIRDRNDVPRYEVHGILGMGGFGLVYLVYCKETKSVYALKTYRDEFRGDKPIQERFRREAQVWVNLDRHPYLVRAHFVDQIYHFGEDREGEYPYSIAMEHIAPSDDGLTSLEDYLRRHPPDLTQSLRWAIQVCYGMEYAYSKGIRSHRDLKPANILISQDKAVKITDFGLAGVLETYRVTPGIRLHIQRGTVGLSTQTVEGIGFGTPTHMPPEQFTNATGCDERSDIYSFGIVLYQMATKGKLPFQAPLPKDDSQGESGRFLWEMHRLHSECSVPRLNSPLFPIIQRCLEKEPIRRYQSFKELRSHLEPLLRHQTGETIAPPQLKELEAWEWLNKAHNLGVLGRFIDAVQCCDRALELNSRDAKGWIQKGRYLEVLGYDEKSVGYFEEAIRCHDRVLELNPRDCEMAYYMWLDKAKIFSCVNRLEEAIRCYDECLKLSPGCTNSLHSKAEALQSLGRFEEAIRCYDRYLEIERGEGPHGNYCLAHAWYCKALCEDRLGRKKDARLSYQQFMTFAPGAKVNAFAHAIEYVRRRLQELD